MAGGLVYFFGSGWAYRAMAVLQREGSLKFHNALRQRGEPNRSILSVIEDAEDIGSGSASNPCGTIVLYRFYLGLISSSDHRLPCQYDNGIRVATTL